MAENQKVKYKVVILCGGRGVRLNEETGNKPKPLVEIGGKPILWHIMKIYSHYGFKDFIIALGYKGEMIADYFENYKRNMSDFTLELGSGKKTYFININENEVDNEDIKDENEWNITFVRTGNDTMTGGRIKRVEKYIDSDTFLVTYGDGVSDVNIRQVVGFHNLFKETHREGGRPNENLATLVGVHLPTTFGVIEAKLDGTIKEFREKPVLSGGWINGGFFVFERKIFDLIKGDETVLEEYPMKTLAKNNEIAVYKHEGFWKCMDTYKDTLELNKIWKSGVAPWKVW
jgi:glucose-1-phosphate cytidylyltransferase